MRVAEVMTKEVLMVPPTMPAAEAWDLMRGRRIHHLVVAVGSEVKGVISARDTGGRSGGSLRVGRSVADLMTTPVVTVAPDVTVRRIANLMRDTDVEIRVPSWSIARIQEVHIMILHALCELIDIRLLPYVIPEEQRKSPAAINSFPVE